MSTSSKLRFLGVLICGAGVTGGTAVGQTAPAAHRQAACASCHDGGAAAVHDAPGIGAACLGCHPASTLPRRTRVGAHAGDGRRCQDCHSFHDTRLVITRAGTLDLDAFDGVDPGHCQGCHHKAGSLTALSPGHRMAAELYHTDPAALRTATPSEACLLCHAQGATSTWKGRNATAAFGINLHASHPLGVRVVPGSGDRNNWIAREIDPRLPLFAGRIECQTCHLLTAPTEDLVVPFPAKYDLCKGCHRHYGDADGDGDLFATMVRR